MVGVEQFLKQIIIIHDTEFEIQVTLAIQFLSPNAKHLAAV